MNREMEEKQVERIEAKPLWHTPGVERIEMKKTLVKPGSGNDGFGMTEGPP